MTAFNAKYFGELMAKIEKEEDIQPTLELMAKLAVPVKIAEEQKLLEKLAKLASHVTMSPLCEKIVKHVNERKKEEEGKAKKEEQDKAKKDRRNEKRRENYKRKREADETIKMEAKKLKTDVSEKFPKETVAVAKPKPAAKKTTLMMKCLKDANKLRKQFK
ncbi:hypothetical protein CAEBREN_05350 [Caenorhabditis brenneri]|uniref:Uncharacterized protein n=1 Tax=Caenorhabditis brenneri TaxID=135651 RepID=G0NX02_CAEBE|nr:hypothetical protein CAEBREN_05350 [Caenorhabditis brenneri]